MTFWIAAALASHAHEKDLFDQWAFVRMAWSDPTRGYDPRLYAELAAAYAPQGGDIHPESAFHREAGPVSYPPVHALLFAPIGLVPPRAAAIGMGLLDVLLALLVARAVAAITEGRLRARVALVLVLVFPGFYYNLALGQNAMVTLAIVSLSWFLLARGRPFLAGLVISILAYKPSWLLAFLWAPAAMGLFGFYAGLAIGIACLLAMTVAAFGLDLWRAWLPVVAWMADHYAHPHRERAMASDLRILAVRGLPSPTGARIGWLLLLLVGGVAVLAWARAAWRRPRAAAAAALCLASVLTCPYVMYYDVLVAMLPVLLLLGHGGSFARGRPWLWAGTGLLYLSLPVMSEWPPAHEFLGPPLATVALGLLFVGALIACRREPGSR